MDDRTLDSAIAAYVGHLRGLEAVFNEWADHVGLPIHMSTAKIVAAVTSGIGLSSIAGFDSRADDTGIIHESQLKTAINCIVELWKNPRSCGHVVGAMQSGKTTTSLALQWAGPAIYQLTGLRACPFYVIGNQTNHEDQTTIELRQFLTYYGHVELIPTGVASKASDAVFVRAPSLANYREHVLRDTLKQQIYAVPELADIIHRRVGGERSVQKIADLCRRATANGYRPLMIIDEPQFGASDRFVRDNEGESVRHPCVLVQIFDRIEKALGSTRDDHWFVGLSATPFELNDLERVWEVRQCLTSAYSGFNFFNGKAIEEDVDVKPPRTFGLTDFGAKIGVPFLGDVSLAAYDRGGASFARHAKRIGYLGDHEQYRDEVETALRETIENVLAAYAAEAKPGESPVGLCIRAFNDNHKTHVLIDALGLDPKKVEILEYFGGDASGMSVKRAISGRKHPELPYIVFVTNRARMADAFPREVRFFIDFAQKASDLNALLQGLLGRACGYGKRSTVVMSDDNANIVDMYVATNGGYVHRTSRHSQAVGGFRRGAPTGMLKVRDEMNDPTVARFFDRINKELVDPNVQAGSRKLDPKRASAANGGPRYRMGPVLRIAEELGLFDYLEKPAVRAELFSHIPTGFKIARRGDEVRHPTRPGVTLKYTADAAGNCRYTFRWASRKDAAQGGAAGRAKGKKDVGQHMEPTIYLEKYDPVSGEVIEDNGVPDDQKRAGRFRAFMVTFPLRDLVREVRAADVAYPTPTCTYDSWMNQREREIRDQAATPAAQSGGA